MSLIFMEPETLVQSVVGGTIEVETLDLANNTMNVVCSAVNFPTPGTYVLFDFNGLIQNGTVANINATYTGGPYACYNLRYVPGGGSAYTDAILVDIY